MFNNYLLTTINNKKELYLYLGESYEFSGNNNSNDNIYNRVNNYINNNKINYRGNKVNFIKNGIIIGSIDLSDYDFNNNRYVEVLKPYNNKLVDLDKSFNIINKYKLNQYIFSIISNNVPACFNIEAIKAIIIAIRTDFYKKLSNNTSIDINIVKIDELKRIWGNKFDLYYDKIYKAINDTDNMAIMYNNDYIDVYYHLSSYGKTEDASNVLNINYPYLISVDSNIDNNVKYINYKIVSNEYLSKLLNMDINEDTNVKVLLKTSGNRVKYIKFNNKVFDGQILSNRLALSSNDFIVSIGDTSTLFTTFGYGNGLGLSMYGANNMANNGFNYIEILHHYYPNTYIEEII